MARYRPILALAFGVGAFIVIAAIVSRQVYLRTAAEAADASADEEPATMMLIRCETTHEGLQNRDRSTSEADERPRARCRES
ncbi:hypothetical protein RM96_28485 [Cupriavidus sp. IDO]|uniref:Uncharacterized protein n=1 Tax=Cupriavidus lacunae TaxID=2666307 RepID=A0A370NRW7_9BURK|nr:hypothetical protein RM96_28485 [Cupriavidus sp. IDO]RDK08268.1 hypothetical protein DN412_21600 [Cupriavidus lacunae]